MGETISSPTTRQLRRMARGRAAGAVGGATAGGIGGAKRGGRSPSYWFRFGSTTDSLGRLRGPIGGGIVRAMVERAVVPFLLGLALLAAACGGGWKELPIPPRPPPPPRHACGARTRSSVCASGPPSHAAGPALATRRSARDRHVPRARASRPRPNRARGTEARD